jgi:hypothetical protein
LKVTLRNSGATDQAVAVEAGAGQLMRDPLRPEASSEATSKVRVMEMEGLYQTQAKVEPDKDASGGYCTRIDYQATR